MDYENDITPKTVLPENSTADVKHAAAKKIPHISILLFALAGGVFVFGLILGIIFGFQDVTYMSKSLNLVTETQFSLQSAFGFWFDGICSAAVLCGLGIIAGKIKK